MSGSVQVAGSAESRLSTPEDLRRRDAFERARASRASALLEDYVELISDLLVRDGEARQTDIARRLGISHATAIKSIGRLKREGLATAKPYRGVFLTPAGQRLAEQIRQKHRLMVAVLLAIGVPPDAAEADAEGMEHFVSEPTLKAIESFLAARPSKP